MFGFLGETLIGVDARPERKRARESTPRKPREVLQDEEQHTDRPQILRRLEGLKQNPLSTEVLHVLQQQIERILALRGTRRSQSYHQQRIIRQQHDLVDRIRGSQQNLTQSEIPRQD